MWRKPPAVLDTPGAFYRGMRKVAIGGTVQDVPDCKAHQHFGRSSRSRGKGPFPQVRKVSLVELCTHVELAFAYGGWKDSERKLVEQLWQAIPVDALLIEDRGIFSFESWRALHSRHQILVRVMNSMAIRPIRQLAAGSDLAKVYRSGWYRANDCHGIVVRVVEYTLDDPQPTGHAEAHRLMVNLIDAEAHHLDGAGHGVTRTLGR